MMFDQTAAAIDAGAIMPNTIYKIPNNMRSQAFRSYEEATQATLVQLEEGCGNNDTAEISKWLMGK